MSEFTNNIEKRNDKIIAFCNRIILNNAPLEAIEENKNLIASINYNDVVWLVDELVKQSIPMEELKKGVNKILNVFYEPLNNKSIEPLKKNTFLSFLEINNTELDKHLKEMRSFIKQLNKTPNDDGLKKVMEDSFRLILQFEHQYVIKENILFPQLEKLWKDYRCVKLMWSFHDDIRRSLREIIGILEMKDFNLKRFNKLTGDIYFAMYAVKFREEKILFPKVLETFTSQSLKDMLDESILFKWAFIQPEKRLMQSKKRREGNNISKIDLHTGALLPEQIRLMINHLPFDITYVDENNKVCYFSSPEKRVFPRSNAIIGRDVKNCHPHESVHVVERIIEAFRSGEKSHADFWIKMKGEYILIQYFALRNENGEYKGVVEVTQEISGIQSIEGERRLLDWDV